MRRRDFLARAAALAGVAAVGGAAQTAEAPRAGQTADTTIDILLDEPIGTISRNVYGHFTEHIGGVIYDGIWVGENSAIPNTHGIRNALLDGLRRIKASVIRWPGGCFADSYDWRDGIGPAASRPTRTNFWESDPDAKRLHERGPQLFETNAFGTDEFMRLCQLSGAKPYLAANLRSLTALDFDHWVEYCNSPAGSTAYAKMRAAGGTREPFDVKYWGVGNESWGCGGNFRPEEYAEEFRRFATWIPTFGEDLYLVAAGPNGDDVDWTRRFFENTFAGPRAYHNRHFRGWSIHHYSRVPKGDALRFDTPDWYALLRSADQTEQIMLDHWAVMGEYDRGHKIKLVVDEYGPWHEEGTEIDPTHIFGQQITIRDALATALTLDCFNRHPEKVGMANCAQLVNNLNALFLAHEEKFWATPNFHVFEMYAPHQDGQALRANFLAPEVEDDNREDGEAFWGLRGSASLQGRTLTITAVNPSTSAAREAQIVLRGAGSEVRSAAATVLAGAHLQAHNTFEDQKAVTPKQTDVKAQGRALRFEFPAASVTKLAIELA